MNFRFQKWMMTAALLSAVATAYAWPGSDNVPNAISPGIEAKLAVRGSLQGVQVVDLRSQRKNDVMVVQAELANQIEYDIQVYYRFKWIDAAGMQVGDGEVWKPLKMLGKQSQTIRSTAPSAQVADFKIEMSAQKL